ncbi:hypothetical protein [Jatrophihabitans sp.]|uniref:hypothetical protein n=1 Tax=Jatrophihabitans sp. TaxID=1932789 RepID=UPI002BF86A6F|nr:hypothetical protein [Jatrophihabitans sp.]
MRPLAVGLSLAALAAPLVSTAGPAGAAVPDRFAFVLYSGGAVVGSGTTPAGTTVAVVGTGQYKITFAGAEALGGVVHVTAINSAPHWCQVNGFAASGTNQVASISCYRPGGAPDFTDFSAIYSSSSGPASPGGAFGYVNSTAGGALVSQYNSAGLGNAVSHTGLGQWTVKFPGLGTPGPMDGSLQATAVSPATVPARCKVLGWSSGTSGQLAQVTCYNAGGAPADTQFTLTYQYQRSLYGGAIPPKYFGYLWNKPVGGPVATNYNSVLGAGANTLSAGTLSLVTFPKLAVLPDDIQVTGSGPGSDFCGLNFAWTHVGADTVVRDVNCFTNAGAPSAAGFLVSDNSAL